MDRHGASGVVNSNSAGAVPSQIVIRYTGTQKPMDVNEPLPGQLTVGRLRELLKDVHEQAVVGLRVRASIKFPPQLPYVLVNLRVANVAPPMVILELQSDLKAPSPEPCA